MCYNSGMINDIRPLSIQITHDTDPPSEMALEKQRDYMGEVRQLAFQTSNLRAKMGVPAFGLKRIFEDGMVELTSHDSELLRIVHLNIITKAIKEAYPSKLFLYSGLMGGPYDALGISDRELARTARRYGFVPTLGMGKARPGITPSEANIAYLDPNAPEHPPWYMRDPTLPLDPLMDGLPHQVPKDEAIWLQRRARPATLYTGLLAVAVQAGLGVGVGSKLTKSGEYWGLQHAPDDAPQWYKDYIKFAVLSNTPWFGGGLCVGPGFFMDFDYRWESCHGILKNKDGVLWTIHISKAKGVTASETVLIPGSESKSFRDKAIKLKDEATVALLDELGGIPLGCNSPLYGLKPTFELLSPDDLTTVYDEWTAHNKAHGWAFSPTDQVCSHSLMRTEENGGLSFSRWSIKFDLDARHPTTGEYAPTASLVNDEEHTNIRGVVFERTLSWSNGDTITSATVTGDVTRDRFDGCREDYPRGLTHYNEGIAPNGGPIARWWSTIREHACGKLMYFNAGTILSPPTTTVKVTDFTATAVAALGLNVDHDVPMYCFYDARGVLIQVRHMSRVSSTGNHGPGGSNYRTALGSNRDGAGGKGVAPYRGDMMKGRSYIAGTTGVGSTSYSTKNRTNGPIAYGCYVTPIQGFDPLDVRRAAPREGFSLEAFDDAWCVIPDNCREAFYFGYMHTIKSTNDPGWDTIPNTLFDDGWEPNVWPGISFRWPKNERVDLTCPWLNTFLPHTFHERRVPYRTANTNGTYNAQAVYSPDTDPPGSARHVTKHPNYIIGSIPPPIKTTQTVRGSVGMNTSVEGAVMDPNPGNTFNGSEFLEGLPWDQLTSTMTYSARYFVSRCSTERAVGKRGVTIQAVPEYDEVGTTKDFEFYNAIGNNPVFREFVLKHPFCHIPIPQVLLYDEDPTPQERPDTSIEGEYRYRLAKSVYSLPCSYSVFGSDKSGGNIGSVVCIGPYTYVGRFPLFYDTITIKGQLEWAYDVNKTRRYKWSDNYLIESNISTPSPMRCYPSVGLAEQKHCRVTAFTLAGDLGGGAAKASHVALGAYFIGYV